MGAKGSRTGLVLLLSAALLAGLMVISAMPVGAEDEEEDQSGIGMDALAGLSADEGGGSSSDTAGTGDLNDPLAGNAGGSSEEADTETTGTPGTEAGSEETATDTNDANPMFRLMLDLILEDVQAAEAKAKASGKTLTEAQRSEIAARSVQDLIAFLQETGILLDVDKRGLAEQIGAIPTEEEE